MNTKIKTSFRHDLGKGAVVGAVSKLAEDSGEIVVLTFDDVEQGARVGIRIRTIEQARELLRAATHALWVFEESRFIRGEDEKPAPH